MQSAKQILDSFYNELAYNRNSLDSVTEGFHFLSVHSSLIISSSIYVVSFLKILISILSVIYPLENMKNGPNPFPHRVGVLITFIKKFTSPLI